MMSLGRYQSIGGAVAHLDTDDCVDAKPPKASKDCGTSRGDLISTFLL
jgi:hypothetical protein